jgi:hypothetical protein
MPRESASRKLEMTLDMFRIGVSFMEAQLRRRYPNLTDAQMVSKLRAWLVDKPPPGGSELQPVRWPRSKRSSALRSRQR